MNRKITALIAAGMLCAAALSSCNAPEAEPATQSSDTEAATIQYKIAETEEKISRAEEATPAITTDKFLSLIENPDLHAVAYEGTDDLIFERDTHTDKTIITDTYGKTEINSSVNELIVLSSPGGVTLNAKTDSIILKGEDVTAEINDETGSVYVVGKNSKVNINKNATVSDILVRNTTAVIYNHSKNDITVILTNGTKITVPGNHTYKAQDNTLTKGIAD